MSAFYDGLTNTALRLLTQFGVEVILRKKGTSGRYNPASGSNVKSEPVEQKRQGVVTDNPGDRIGQQYGENFQHGDLNKRTGKWMYMDGKGLEPAVEDEVVVQGIKYQLVDVQKIGPGGQTVLYLVVMKR